MLTKNDLEQIRGVVREEVQSETASLKKDMIVVKRKITRLQKDMNFIIKDYSNAMMHLRRKVEKN